MIENTTTRLHAVFPGKISRMVTNYFGQPEIFTHGLGINRFRSDTWVPPRGLNVVLGCGNELFGEEAFKALDIAALNYLNSLSGPETDEQAFDAQSGGGAFVELCTEKIEGNCINFQNPAEPNPN